MGSARRRPGASSPPGLADLARLRQAAYRLFGEVLRPPEPERVASLSAVARDLADADGPFAPLVFFPLWKRFLHALADGGHGHDRQSPEAYVRLFVANTDGVCPLVASHYLAPEAPALVMGEMERWYALAGLSLAAGLAEPPDHAAVELDFMSLLCGEELEAWSREAVDAGVRGLEREAIFLDRHLCRWFPEFVRRVASRDGQSFYGLAADTIRAFVLHDLDLVTALRLRFREAAGG